MVLLPPIISFLPADQLFYVAWSIGRSIALARSLKKDPVTSLLASSPGLLLFTGKIISVTRKVASGFTRGSVLLEASTENEVARSLGIPAAENLTIDFENENLCATLKASRKGDKVLASCPDLIVVSTSLLKGYIEMFVKENESRF